MNMRILHITSDLDGGGIERLLLNYCRILQKKGIQFDFAINAQREGLLEKSFKELGANIYRIPTYHDGIKKYKRALEEILLKNSYDVVHVHSGYKAFIPLMIAKKHGIKVRIAHSHTTNVENKKEYLVKKLCVALTKKYATDLFACGISAGKWAWGRKAAFDVMYNSIKTEKYLFNEEKRCFLRDELHISNKFVLGNVGRFSIPKNHEFLINFFYEIVKKCPNAVLLLIGRGELEKKIQKKIADLGIQNSVMMLGIRDDVPDLLNAMDLFLLPSKFEGLPVSLVEVQANGLRALAANTITKEVAITDLVKYIPLDDYSWINAITELPVVGGYDRSMYNDVIAKSNYDIGKSSVLLIEKYQSLIKKNNGNADK